MNRELTMYLKDWGLKDIVLIVEEIRQMAPLHTFLAAHLEHELWGDVLRKVAQSAPYAAEMAALALSTLEIPFDRSRFDGPDQQP